MERKRFSKQTSNYGSTQLTDLMFWKNPFMKMEKCWKSDGGDFGFSLK
ncbi:MAG: hypothetical protein Ct9H300mP5_0230 [Candidatus Pelagibacterales bacterium]|nr:MAG: hypothetical protein Ct9H300mP5_0230 [Pelagibacterales bacterium]